MSTVTPDHDVVPKVGAAVCSRFFMGFCGFLLCIFGTLHVSGLIARKDHFLRDFVQEWSSARNWLVGRPVYQDLRVAIPFHFPNSKLGDLKFNAHPPAAVVLALPFGSFRYQRALKAWNLLSLGCVILAVCWLAGKRGFNLRFGEQLFVSGIVLSSSVLESELIQGQLNGILLVLLVAAWRLTREEHDVAAGVSVGLAASLKLFPGLLILYFLARRKWKACLALMATWLITNAAAAGILGWAAIQDYVWTVMPDLNRFVDTWPNASLLGFLSRLFDGGFGQVTPLVQWPLLAIVLWATLSLLLVGITVRATCRGNATDLQFSMWVSLMLLVSPVAWDHYFLLAILPLTALWHSQGVNPLQRRVFLLFAMALLVVFSPYQVWHFLVPGYTKHGMVASVAHPTTLVMGISFQFYASLAVFGSCLHGCRESALKFRELVPGDFGNHNSGVS